LSIEILREFETDQNRVAEEPETIFVGLTMKAMTGLLVTVIVA